MFYRVKSMFQHPIDKKVCLSMPNIEFDLDTAEAACALELEIWRKDDSKPRSSVVRVSMTAVLSLR